MHPYVHDVIQGTLICLLLQTGYGLKHFSVTRFPNPAESSENLFSSSMADHDNIYDDEVIN